ncbi:MAG: response regulator [Asticcacaulis sp.]
MALKKLENEGFHLVLMDGSMPVMDGFEATRRLRAREQTSSETRTPVIALTAHVVGSAASAWREAGMDDVLYKPFTLQGLAAVLRTWLPPGLAEAPAGGPPKPPSPRPWPASRTTCSIQTSPRPLIAGLKSERGDFVRKVIGLYRSHAPKAADDIETAHQSGRDDDVARAAHALKSMSLNLGARAVSEAAAVLERAVRVQHRGVTADEIVTVRVPAGTDPGRPRPHAEPAVAASRCAPPPIRNSVSTKN